MPYPVYDGLRLFIWFIPYVCIIPAFVIYFLINNINPLKNKFSSLILTFLIIFYLVNFFGYTPYQYTYLNIFNGKSDKKSSKFENDYWGVSIKELVEKNSSLIKKIPYRISNFLIDKGITYLETSEGKIILQPFS